MVDIICRVCRINNILESSIVFRYEHKISFEVKVY